MARERLPGGALFPAIWPISGTNLFVSKTMDASAEKVSFVVLAPKTGTLHGFEVKLGAVSQAPTNGLRFSFQDRSLSDGNPDGSQDAYRVVTSGITANAWLATGIMSSDGTDGGALVSVVRGQPIFCVVQFESFNASDNVKIDAFSATATRGIYTDSYTSLWTKSTGDSPIVALRYDDGTYPMLRGWVYPILTADQNTINTGTTPDEVGMRFSLPTPLLIGGAFVRSDFAGDCDICLYDSQNNLLTSVSLDKDCRNSAVLNGTSEVLFPADIPIAGNEIYRLTVKPTSATSIIVDSYSVAQAGMLDLMDGGATWVLTSRSDAGAFTDETVKRPWMGVLITGVDHELGGQPSTGFEGTP